MSKSPSNSTSCSSILTLLSIMISPFSILPIAERAFSPWISSMNFTGRPRILPNSLACPKVEVKSFFPGLLWCASNTTLDLDKRFRVGTILLILVSSKNTLVTGSRGELMSTRTMTVRPSRLTSSRVRTLAIKQVH